MLHDSMNSFASSTTAGTVDFSLRVLEVGGDMTYIVTLTHSVTPDPRSITSQNRDRG